MNPSMMSSAKRTIALSVLISFVTTSTFTPLLGIAGQAGVRGAEGSAPTLQATLAGPCKSVPRERLESKYILRNKGDLKTDLDDPSSRTWVFSNLRNDLIGAVQGENEGAPLECLDSLYVASMSESFQYWAARGRSSGCTEAARDGECAWVNQNLRYLAKLGKEFSRRMTQVAQEAQREPSVGRPADEVRASVGKSCSTKRDRTAPVQLQGSIADVRAQLCCEVFKTRDREIKEPAQCEKLLNGTAPIPGTADCVKSTAMGILKGLKSQLSILTDVFSGAFWSGIATLVREFSTSPVRALEMFVKGLMRSFGIDSEYSECLHPNLKGPYYCDMAGNILAQVGMLAGGWTAIFKIMKAGGALAAAKIPGAARIADALRKTRMAPGKVVTAAKAAGKATGKAAVKLGKKSPKEAGAAIARRVSQLKSMKLAEFWSNPFKSNPFKTRAGLSTNVVTEAAEGSAIGGRIASKAAQPAKLAGAEEQLAREVVELEQKARLNGPGSAAEKELREARKELQAVRESRPLSPTEQDLAGEIVELKERARFNEDPSVQRRLGEAEREFEALRSQPRAAAPEPVKGGVEARSSVMSETAAEATVGAPIETSSVSIIPKRQYKSLQKSATKERKALTRLMKRYDKKRNKMSPEQRSAAMEEINRKSASLAETEARLSGVKPKPGLFESLRVHRKRGMTALASSAEGTRQVSIASGEGVYDRERYWEAIDKATQEATGQAGPANDGEPSAVAASQGEQATGEEIPDEAIYGLLRKQFPDSTGLSNKELLGVVRKEYPQFAEFSDAAILDQIRFGLQQQAEQ